jgi:uncharacterized protein
MGRPFSAYIALLCALLAPAAWAAGLDTSKLKPTGYVNDFAHKVDPASAQALEAYCANLERLTGAQLAIVLVDALDDEPIEDAANRLYREWGIGKKGKDEGILLMLSVNDKKSRAEVGYGLEPIITDGEAGGILRSLRPLLRQGDYGPALLAAAQQIGGQIAKDKGVDLGVGMPARPQPRGRTVSIPFPLILLGIFLLFSLLGRGGRGGGTGFLTGMILGNLMGGRRGGDWGGGGFGGYDGGGGGGFGGFGGGSSGGGGASSDW